MTAPVVCPACGGTLEESERNRTWTVTPRRGVWHKLTRCRDVLHAQLTAERAKVEEATKALEEIATDPNCTYLPAGDEYDGGVADGHRYAAMRARTALERLRKHTSGEVAGEQGSDAQPNPPANVLRGGGATSCGSPGYYDAALEKLRGQ